MFQPTRWKQLPKTPIILFAYILVSVALGGSNVPDTKLSKLVTMFASVAGVIALCWAPKRSWTPVKVRSAKLLFVPTALMLAVAFIQLAISLNNSGYPDRLSDLSGTVAPLDTLIAVTMGLTAIGGLAVFLVLLPMLTGRQMALVCYIIATASSILGLLQQLLYPQIPLYLQSYVNYGLPTGPFANANHHACFLNMLLPLSLYYLAPEVRLFSKWSWHSSKEIQRAILRMIPLVLIILTIILTKSLAGLGLMVGILITCIAYLGFAKVIGRFLRHTSRPLVALIGVTIFLICACLLTIFGLLEPVSSEISRTVIWRNTFGMIYEKWGLGVGIGAFETAYRFYEPSTNVQQVFVNRAHNDYLELAAEVGVPIFIGLMLYAAWLGNKAFYHLANFDDGFTIQQAVSLGLGGLALHSFVDYPARTPAIMMIVVIYLLIVIAPSILRNESDAS